VVGNVVILWVVSYYYEAGFQNRSRHMGRRPQLLGSHRRPQQAPRARAKGRKRPRKQQLQLGKNSAVLAVVYPFILGTLVSKSWFEFQVQDQWEFERKKIAEKRKRKKEKVEEKKRSGEQMVPPPMEARPREEERRGPREDERRGPREDERRGKAAREAPPPTGSIPRPAPAPTRGMVSLGRILSSLIGELFKTFWPYIFGLS